LASEKDVQYWEELTIPRASVSADERFTFAGLRKREKGAELPLGRGRKGRTVRPGFLGRLTSHGGYSENG
jgi:hypothetical protein